MKELFELSVAINVVFLVFIIKFLKRNWRRRITRKQLFKMIEDLDLSLDDSYRESRKKSEQIRRLRIQVKKLKQMPTQKAGNIVA